MKADRLFFALWLRERPWAIRPLGWALIVLTPIVWPWAMIRHLWPEIRRANRLYWNDVLTAARFTGFHEIE
jgi:hypothetical protein